MTEINKRVHEIAVKFFDLDFNDEMRPEHGLCAKSTVKEALEAAYRAGYNDRALRGLI